MTTRPLESVGQTAAQMVRMVETYAGDIGEMASWPLPRYFRHIANLEYRADPKGHESVSRPALTLGASWPWRDCDDKAVLMGSWCYLNGVPFHFVASSKRPDKTLHHTWVIADLGGRPLPLDATYPRNYLGWSDPANTRIEPLTGDIMQPTLNTFEGDGGAELLGRSLFRKAFHYTPVGFALDKRKALARLTKKAAPGAAAAATGPLGLAALAAYKRKKHGRVFAGDAKVIELLGSSFLSRMKRRARKAAPWALAAATGPIGLAALAAYKRKKHGRVFAGAEFLGDDLQGAELLGRSFMGRMARRTKNLARQTGNLARQAAPVLDIVAPGLSSRIQSITGKIKGGGAKKEEEINLAPAAAAPIWKKPWFIPAVGGAAVLLLLMSRKSATPAPAST